MDWYQRLLVETGRAAAVWALIGFLVTFAITRGITRRIRAKNSQPAPTTEAGGGGLSDIYIAGVHVHHQVWGILLVLVSGLIEFRFSPESPWTEVLAALFGIGAALALDEFALWFHLDDVYWGAEGRKSIDAILIAGALGAALLLQGSPIGAARPDDVATWLYLLGVTVHLVSAVICFLKGKIATGMIGIVVPIVATVGAIRLAKPTSVWGRRRYSGGKLARSQQRFDVDYEQRRNRLRDRLGGAPEAAAVDPETPAHPSGPSAQR
ncbi:hypothetical protein ACVBEQ_08675 [Nakamurella sp. GG22]